MTTRQSPPAASPLLVRWLGGIVIGAGGLGLAALGAFAASRLTPDSRPDQILTFVVAPFGVAALCAASFRLHAHRRGEIALGLVAFGVGLVVAEVILGLGLRAASTQRASGGSIGDYVAELRTDGLDAFPTVPGNVLVDLDHPLTAGDRVLYPLSPAPGRSTAVLCVESGRREAYRADRYGFRNPDQAWDRPVDVVMIGDSYAAGTCVADDEELAWSLRNGWNTLNLALRGAGPLTELGVLREYGAPMRPRVVVWVYYEGNDVWDLSREESRPWLTDYLDPSHTQGLAGATPIMDPAYRSWLDSLSSTRAVAGRVAPPTTLEVLRGTPRLSALRATLHFGVRFPDPASSLGILPQVLERARDDVHLWGGEILFVYLPAYERFGTWLGDGVAGHEELLRLTRELGIPTVDGVSTLEASGHPTELWPDPRGHLGPEGYRLLGSAIRRRVADLVPLRADIGPVGH